MDKPTENIDQGDLSHGALSNHFLIAMPSLNDSLFAHTVTLICEHSDEGAMGIVVNSPLALSLDEVFSQMELPSNALIGHQAVLSGGPVQVERGFVLHRKGQVWDSTMNISDDISLTVSKDVISAMAEAKGPKNAVMALGYAGWGAGQLEAEIADNAWLTLPADSAIIFDTPCEQRWNKAAESLGIDLNLISTSAGHA